MGLGKLAILNCVFSLLCVGEARGQNDRSGRGQKDEVPAFSCLVDHALELDAAERKRRVC